MPADRSDLASLGLFAALPEPELAAIAALFEAKSVDAAVRLVSEGTTGFSFFVVISGAVEVIVGGRVVAALGAGEFFGEMSLLGSGRRTATVTTTMPTRVLVMFGDDFGRLRAERPEIVARIEAAMRARLGDAQAERAPSSRP